MPYSSCGKLRSVSALALVLWFAGAGCVFVSYARGAMSAHACLSDQALASHSAPHSDSGEDANTVVVGGTNSSCKAKPAAASRRTQQKASVLKGRAENSVAAPTTSAASQKYSCPRQSQPAQQRQNSLIEVASALSGTLPPSGSMNCCPLSRPVATVVTKLRSDNNPSATTPERTASPAFISDAQTSPLSPPLRLPNRGHTYLRCCVFLI